MLLGATANEAWDGLCMWPYWSFSVCFQAEFTELPTSTEPGGEKDEGCARTLSVSNPSRLLCI